MKKLSSLRNKADKLYQEVGMRNNPNCLLCGKPANCLHHFIAKSVSSALRYELKNGIPLCVGCHLRLHNSGDPEYELKIQRIKGKKWYNDLQRLRTIPVNTNKKYYKEIIDSLNDSLNDSLKNS